MEKAPENTCKHTKINLKKKGKMQQNTSKTQVTTCVEKQKLWREPALNPETGKQDGAVDLNISGLA